MRRPAVEAAALTLPEHSPPGLGLRSHHLVADRQRTEAFVHRRHQAFARVALRPGQRYPHDVTMPGVGYHLRGQRLTVG